jgi:hypothetical protein
MGSRSLELTSEQILRSRGKHSKIPPDRVCSNCGKKTTRMIGKYPLWRRHGVNIVCQKCYGELNKKGTKPLKCDICGRWKTLSHHTCYTSPRRQCWKCGNNTTRMKKGKHPVWRHHYDGQGEHIVCESCFKELHKKGRYRIRHRRCYLCKTDKSVEGTNRQNHWYRYDDGFVCGYVCKDCNRITKGVRPLQEYLESIKVSPDRKCSKCGGSETEVDKKGQAHWFKDGNEGFWCRNCYREEHLKDPQALEIWREHNRRCAARHRKNLTKEGKEKQKKYQKEYVAKNWDKLAEYRHSDEQRKKGREHKKLSKVKQARNKRLKDNRLLETKRQWGHNAQQEFRSRVKGPLDELVVSNIAPEELDKRLKKISEDRVSILRINHIPADRKCSKCGGSETEVDKKGQAHWFKDGNEGFWCRNCYNKNKRKLRKQPRRLPINHIPADRKCSKCGSFKTQLNKKGHAYWFDNHKGNGGFWCRNCYRKERMKDPQVLEKTRAAGRRYAAEHRRKEKDIRQARSQMMRAREPT